MKHLINIFLEPGKVFAELKDKPTFWLPLLLMMVLPSVMTLMYFMKVDPSWYVDHMLLARGSEMSASELAQAKAAMPSPKVMGYIGVPMTIIGVLIIYSISALYYMLAGKITGNAVGFKRGFSLACWASVPVLLGTLVVIVGIFSMAPQTALESLALTRVDPLFVQLPMDHDWSMLVKSFDLLSIWSIFLIALGWRTWGNTSWSQAIVVALIPSVLVFGGMALFAAL